MPDPAPLRETCPPERNCVRPGTGSYRQGGSRRSSFLIWQPSAPHPPCRRARKSAPLRHGRQDPRQRPPAGFLPFLQGAGPPPQFRRGRCTRGAVPGRVQSESVPLRAGCCHCGTPVQGGRSSPCLRARTAGPGTSLCPMPRRSRRYALGSADCPLSGPFTQEGKLRAILHRLPVADGVKGVPVLIVCQVHPIPDERSGTSRRKSPASDPPSSCRQDAEGCPRREEPWSFRPGPDKPPSAGAGLQMPSAPVPQSNRTPLLPCFSSTTPTAFFPSPEIQRSGILSAHKAWPTVHRISRRQFFRFITRFTILQASASRADRCAGASPQGVRGALSKTPHSRS